MANIAQIVNVLQSVIMTRDAQMVKTPTYHVFNLYKVHQDAMLIPSEVITESYRYEDKSIPALTASASEKEELISITLTNSNPHKNLQVKCDIGRSIESISGRIVNSMEITDYNDFNKAEKVFIEAVEINQPKNNTFDLTIPAHSVLLIQLKLD